MNGMVAAVQSFDWSQTPLGPIDRWPCCLRVAVDICLRSRFPMFVWWGPERINIYNDGYAPMLGKRHPSALGRPARETWAEIWHVVGPQADAVFDRGESTWNERVRLDMERHGHLEETYFTWSYSPIREESGGVGGLFCAVTEDTARVMAERANHEAQGRAAAIFEAARDAIIVYTPEGTVLEVNSAACAMYGLSREDLIGLHAPSAIHPDARPMFEQFLHVATAGGEFRCQTVDHRSDGTVFPIEVVGTSFSHGGRLHLLAVIHDVSARIQAEEQAHAILESINDAFYAVDADFNLTYVNRRAEQLWRRPRKTLIGKHFWTEFPEAVGTESHRMHLKAMAERSPVQLETLSPIVGRWVDVSIYPEAGAGGLTCYFRDISDRKRAEAAVRESESRFRLMADSAPVLIWMADTQNRGTWFNRPWLDFTGRTLEQEKGLGWIDSVHPEDRERCAAQCNAAFARREPFSMEFRLRRHDGQHRWVLDNARPLYSAAGEFQGYIGSCVDITEQRRATEAAERASAAKSEFLATLSHELRTPLTPVMLTVSLLENHPALADELREDVATVRRNVELESRLISDLLDLTRIEKGKLNLDVQDVDVHLVVRTAVDICQREASANLVVELEANRHVVRGDSTRLQQVFWNLINNAMKFLDPGGTVAVRSFDSEDDRIRIEVSDTGVGIDPSVLPKLFSAFEQGETRAHRQQAGLGLGLAISKRLVEMHGGTISAASEGRGKGATFAVELPTVNVYTITTVVTPAPRAMAAAPLNVLLVEDHEATLSVLTRLLRGLGHRVTAVSTAASAVAAARQGGFDLLICDLGLPDGSGLDVMREVREHFADRALALTGYGMESDIAASRAAGFIEHLTKPVALETLDAVIARVVKSASRSRREPRLISG